MEKAEEHVKDTAEVQRDLMLLRAAKPDQLKMTDTPGENMPPAPGAPPQKPTTR